MPVSKKDIFRISRETVISSITGFIKGRENKVPKFQILDLIIPTERRIRSVVGGMETSLGTTLWEPLAKNLAALNGFEVVNENLQAPVNMPSDLLSTISVLINGRMSRNKLYSGDYCHNRIKEVCQLFINSPISYFNDASTGFGVDIWLKKDGTNYFFDTKTVQANVGSYTKFFHQILNWYGYFYSRYPEGNASAKIVFPYNPYGEKDFWSKTMGGGFPLQANSEGWVENDFWDFCTGTENSYEEIYNSFISISDEGDLETIVQEMFYGSGSESDE